MAAYAAYELERKREEELARQAAEEEHHAEMRAEARARAEVEWDRASAKKKASQSNRKSLDDRTQAEKLAAYQQTATYKNYQAKMQTWEQEKKNEQLHAYDAVENMRAGRADTSSQASTLRQAWEGTKKIVITAAYESYKWADNELDQKYDYHGFAHPPTGVTGQLWSALPNVSSSTPQNYILNQYHVYQVPTGWQSLNECVTAATIQGMNMMQDILNSNFGIGKIPHSDLKSFTSMFDSMGPRNWVTRPPANTPIIGGMLLPQQAERVLNAHGQMLRENYGCGYMAKLTSGNTPNDLIRNLYSGYPTSIHIAYPKSLFDRQAGYLALFGGSPHTVTLAGYDANTDTWKILDPGTNDGRYTEWHTPELMELWGRQFAFYPPRFAMTTLIPDTTCTPKITIPIPSAIPVPTSPTIAPSQTVEPPSPIQQKPTGTPEP